MNHKGLHDLDFIKEATNRYWISARQLMKRTRLSRHDFSRYIKLGILPKPVIRYDGLNPRGSRKNGYLPKSMLERVKMAEQLRRKGHPMDQIAQKFRDGLEPETETESETQSPGSEKQDHIIKAAGRPCPDRQGGGSNPDTPDSCSVQSFLEKISTSPGPVSVNLAALAVELNQWCNWRNRLLARQYHSLLKSLLTTAAGVFSSHQGIYFFQPPAGIVCLFVEQLHKDYLFNAVNCALDLQLAGRRILKTSKTEQGHRLQVQLNMGLHAGMEPLACLDVSGARQVIALGNVAELASQLAEAGCNGQIWASKELFSRLPEAVLKKIKFGVPKMSDGWEVFLAGCFATIQELELFNDQVDSNISLTLKALAVTQVLELESGNRKE